MPLPGSIFSNILLFVLPPGAFVTLGYLIAIFNKVAKK